MDGNDIRRTFLDFYKGRDHRIFPSFSLIPEDPTLLFTVAGMVPFKPYFSGERPVEFARAASCQKSIRTNDIENVGLTARHQTFFEMLGNFSFADYFKEDAIKWAWELSVGPFGLEPERIWVTTYEEDDDSVQIWHDVVGIPAERIIRRGADDNFWWMGVAGPGGPSSELFYDRGPKYGDVEGFQDGDRIMEFYNLVFTEFQVDDEGRRIADLPNRNVDTGLGLERLAQILQDVPTAYETDLLRPIVARAEKVSSTKYGDEKKADVSLRILAEHSRAGVFLIGDGVTPANEGRGFVLRRLLRRAIRHARLLGVDRPMMREMVEAVVETMGDAYPELPSARAYIEQVVAGEEEGFHQTLRLGESLLDDEIDKARESGSKTLPGDVAFKLHDTYGFPFELTLEIAQDAGLTIERADFERLMDEQRRRARSDRRAKLDLTDSDALTRVLSEAGATLFTGYERTDQEAKLVGIVRSGELVEAASEGDEIEVVLDTTPFYPEGGGQVGDHGVIEIDGARLEVTDTQRRLGDLIVHTATVARGEVQPGTPAFARVDPAWRIATERSHSATHILHATLRQTLGEQSRQAGSLVEPGRLRFDFPYHERVPREVLDEIEETVNRRLLWSDPVRAYETTMAEARARGALMLFEEKYGDFVRVVEIGNYSVELCGGTHVTRTSDIGVTKVLGESSIGSNLRRIEALTGQAAIEDFRRSRAVLEQIAALLRTTPEEAPARVERLLADLKGAEQQIKKAQSAGQKEQASTFAERAETIGSAKVVIADVPRSSVGDLQKLAVAVRDAIGAPAAVVLGSADDGRAGIVAAVDKGTASSGVKAAALIAQAARAIGGGAGGRDDVATGGGKNVEGLPEALRLARAAAEELFR
ncbi:MAG TPA: alanine--tRNA ligase [Actinomycetota bacterium]|nr:alanine--tRNA ligase [Actinomycetota bacterium]